MGLGIWPWRLGVHVPRFALSVWLSHRWSHGWSVASAGQTPGQLLGRVALWHLVAVVSPAVGAGG